MQLVNSFLDRPTTPLVTWCGEAAISTDGTLVLPSECNMLRILGTYGRCLILVPNIQLPSRPLTLGMSNA